MKRNKAMLLSSLDVSTSIATELSGVQTAIVAFRHPSADDLVDYCVTILDTLAWVGLLDHVLILVDDIDLIQGYRNPEDNGQIQRNRLTDALLKLHTTPRIDVLMTARSWYGQTHKELEILVDLATSIPLTSSELMEIHDAHFKQFVGRKKLPVEFLEKEALGYVASNTDALPGVFLQILKTTFHTYYKEETDWGLRDVNWLLEIYQGRFKNLRQLIPEAAEMIELAFLDDRLNIDIEERNPFLHTIAMDEMVYQSYYSESRLFIPSLIRKAYEKVEST